MQTIKFYKKKIEKIPENFDGYISLRLSGWLKNTGNSKIYLWTEANLTHNIIIGYMRTWKRTACM